MFSVLNKLCCPPRGRTKASSNKPSAAKDKNKDRHSQDRKMPFVSLSDIREVDYIIVGGGTSGLTLAARLTEDSNIKVLVIEAGGYYTSVPEIDVPGLLGRTVGNPKYDWSFVSVPQKRANDRVVRQPRGKGLGGSSLINYLGMFRPSKAECDALEEVFGNKGWNWDSLQYFAKKSETAFLPKSLSASDAEAIAAKPQPDLHGTNGPLFKSLPPTWTKSQVQLFDSAEALGIPRNSETCGGKTVGSMTAFSSIDPRTAVRSQAANAYLEPHLGRDNLLLLTDVQVTKVLLETGPDSLQKAIGVEVSKDGVVSEIKGVRKDVIISCGSLQTPQILELSGIGNPAILSKFNIPTIIDLPGVGENLQDHVSVSTIVEIDDTEESYDSLKDPETFKKHEELYKQQQGLLVYGPVPAYIFLPASALGTKDELASWQEHARTYRSEGLSSAIPSLKAGLEKQYALLEKLFADSNQAQAELLQFLGHPRIPYSTPVAGKRYTSLLCALMHPLSRGSVHIASSDPLAPPAIDPNYFANEADLDLLAHIVRFAVQLYNTPPLNSIVKAQVIPSKEILDGGIPTLKEYARANCGPVYHPIGTAAMLPREDGGVVDNTLKVYGTSNLRVVDLSILPLELSCHTQAMAYTIGEKAADILKSEVGGQ